jgi:hypothetical protein
MRFTFLRRLLAFFFVLLTLTRPARLSGLNRLVNGHSESHLPSPRQVNGHSTGPTIPSTDSGASFGRSSFLRIVNLICCSAGLDLNLVGLMSLGIERRVT